ncbi:MAG: hypothetical protein HKN77_07465 [Woeseiaceae bacterium]|nr:hypothetical protein [Woeseiaceae bacterium]
MPAFSSTHVIIAVLAVIAGVVLGWIVRGRRCAREKAAVNAGWQEQLEAQRLEHSRLVDQNKGLMEQVSQFQASNSDATKRSAKLAASLKEASARRDTLQRELADARDELESIVGEREQLEHDARDLSLTDNALKSALDEKDEKIFKLSRELESWHQRLPPLIARYRERNKEAERLEGMVESLTFDLAESREKIHGLESVLNSDETRVEALDPHTLPGRMDASNDTVSSTAIGAQVGVDTLRDDLKRIKGIGPAIEKTLNELGIFRLSQIAEMGEYDIDRVANKLRGFRSRIYREDWIGQARDLQDPPTDNDA